MSPSRPELSKSELEIARVVWELGEATVRQVHEAVASTRDVDFTTVQTWLRRLEQKGYLKTRLERRVRVYSPRVRPTTVIRETVDDLVGRLFAGDSMPLVHHLIEDRGMTAEQISQLRDLLDRLERSGPAKAQGAGND